MPTASRRAAEYASPGQYDDHGCEMHPSCCHCPLEFCKFDDPSVNRSDRMWARHQRIHELTEEGLTRRQVADRVGCSIDVVGKTLRGDISAIIPRSSQNYPDNRRVLRRLKPASSLFRPFQPPRLLAKGRRPSIK